MSLFSICKNFYLVLKRRTTKLFEYFNKLSFLGIPIMNVDPFEPLYLDRVSVSKGAGPVTLAGSFYNLTVVGPSNATPTYTE